VPVRSEPADRETTGPEPTGSPVALDAAGAVGDRSGVHVLGVRLGYGGRDVLVADHLVVPPGTVAALIGPNGAGKSTLLHALAGIRSPRVGEILVNGRPVAEASQSIAYVLQSTHVSSTLPLSVREVVTMGRYAGRGLFGRLGRSDRAAVDTALERLDIIDLARRQLGALSGGQRQRVFVAQGLAQEADLLLLDEPVTGLDLVTQDRILDVVAEERAAGRAVILSTHDLAEASRADQLVLLAGRIIATGSPAQVLTEANLTAAYGGRMVRLPGGAVLLDDASHHSHS
jgi:manganese transport system ATP-binding protein